MKKTLLALLQSRNTQQQTGELLDMAEKRLNEAEKLLRKVDLLTGELKESLTVMLLLTDLLLAEVAQDNRLKSDLLMLNKHSRRMSDTVRGFNVITHYNILQIGE